MSNYNEKREEANHFAGERELYDSHYSELFHELFKREGECELCKCECELCKCGGEFQEALRGKGNEAPDSAQLELCPWHERQMVYGEYLERYPWHPVQMVYGKKTV